MTLSRTVIIAAVVVAGIVGVAFTGGAASALEMTGQQYFANGTAIAYFDDGSTSKFSHEMTPQEGWYYDNTTVFYYGEIPGISTADNAKCSGGFGGGGNTTMTSSSNGDDNNGVVVELTIINGANLIENKSRAIQPSPITEIKVGDTVTWKNEDLTTHTISAPPGHFMFSGEIPSGETFSSILSSTQSSISEDRSLSCTFTEPGGFHYDIDNANNGIVGTVIVK